jgi:hypothetical protein
MSLAQAWGVLWDQALELPGIDLNEAAQLELLDRFQSRYQSEYEGFPTSPAGAGEFHFCNGLFDYVDAIIYYCMIRDRRPGRIVEVGGGFSSFLSAAAARRNREETGRECELTVVEPYPRAGLDPGLAGLTRLVPSKVQEVPLEVFTELGAGDILFIDSSHISAIGSDVNHLFHQALPRLAEGGPRP